MEKQNAKENAREKAVAIREFWAKYQTPDALNWEKVEVTEINYIRKDKHTGAFYGFEVIGKQAYGHLITKTYEMGGRICMIRSRGGDVEISFVIDCA